MRSPTDPSAFSLQVNAQPHRTQAGSGTIMTKQLTSSTSTLPGLGLNGGSAVPDTLSHIHQLNRPQTRPYHTESYRGKGSLYTNNASASIVNGGNQQSFNGTSPHAPPSQSNGHTDSAHPDNYSRIRQRLREVLEDNARMGAQLDDARSQIKRLRMENEMMVDRLSRKHDNQNKNTINGVLSTISISSSTSTPSMDGYITSCPSKRSIQPANTDNNFTRPQTSITDGYRTLGISRPPFTSSKSSNIKQWQSLQYNTQRVPQQSNTKQLSYEGQYNMRKVSDDTFNANNGWRVPKSADAYSTHGSNIIYTDRSIIPFSNSSSALRRPRAPLAIAAPSSDDNISGAGYSPQSATSVRFNHFSIDNTVHRLGGPSSVPLTPTTPPSCISQHTEFPGTTIFDASGAVYLPGAVQRSAGKRRKRHHDISSKVRSVQPVPRDKDGNYIMPVQVGILTVLSLGHVICDKDAYHNERYIWPVGYVVQREYYSMIDPNKQVIYTCRITNGGDSPRFHVEPEDMPGSPIIATTATGAWTTVLRTVNQIRHREHSNSASGPDYFGFSHPTIAKMIQDLPGADKCRSYIMQKFVEMKDRHVRGVIKKGRGGRPSMEMLNRGQRALMATSGDSKILEELHLTTDRPGVSTWSSTNSRRSSSIESTVDHNATLNNCSNTTINQPDSDVRGQSSDETDIDYSSAKRISVATLTGCQ